MPVELPPKPAPNNPANYNSTISTTPGVMGTNVQTLPTIDTPAWWGVSANVGVFGSSTIGVQGTARGNDGIGVQGTATESGGIGIQGVGVTAGVLGISQSKGGIGVHGQSSNFDAVVGETSSTAHAGVTGRNTTKEGAGIYGTGGQWAGKFDGPVVASSLFVGTGLPPPAINGNAVFDGSLSVEGNVTVHGDVRLANKDCAEDFDVAASSEFEAGTVMVLNECGLLKRSDQEYDKKVAGVVSGAGDLRPGLVLGRDGEGRQDHQRAPLALVGKVYCKVDAKFGQVDVGDLLTTSSTPGHAMKADDPIRAFGAVIGKALQSLPAGERGLIPILVALQ